MSALTVNGDLNIMGKFRINGEPLNVDGADTEALCITSAEQATGEKFMGRDVFIKGWEGQLTGAKTNADFIIPNFLPSASCRVLSYGGDVMYDCAYNTSIIIGLWGNLNFYKSGANIYFVKGIGGMQEDSPNLRFWVKYTHS
jgi:hypothetical protein